MWHAFDKIAKARLEEYWERSEGKETHAPKHCKFPHGKGTARIDRIQPEDCPVLNDGPTRSIKGVTSYIAGSRNLSRPDGAGKLFIHDKTLSNRKRRTLDPAYISNAWTGPTSTNPRTQAVLDHSRRRLQNVASLKAKKSKKTFPWMQTQPPKRGVRITNTGIEITHCRPGPMPPPKGWWCQAPKSKHPPMTRRTVLRKKEKVDTKSVDEKLP